MTSPAAASETRAGARAQGDTPLRAMDLGAFEGWAHGQCATLVQAMTGEVSPPWDGLTTRERDRWDQVVRAFLADTTVEPGRVYELVRQHERSDDGRIAWGALTTAERLPWQMLAALCASWKDAR